MNEAEAAERPLRRSLAPFMRALGSFMLGGVGQRIRWRLPFSPAACAPGGDTIDLRAVAALLDHAGGAAVFAALPDLKATATLELRMDLVGTPSPGQDICVDAGCEAIDAGSVLVVGDAWCLDVAGSARRPVARMTGRFVVGVGPGQRPGDDAWRAREATAAAHVAVAPPSLRSFEELLGGMVTGHAFALPPAPWLVGSIALPALHGGAVADERDGAVEMRQRQHVADQRSDAAFVVHRHRLALEVSRERAVALARLAEIDPDQRRALDQREVRSQRVDGAAGEGDHQVAAAPAQGAERGVGRVATDRVEHGIDAARRGERLDRVFPVAGGVDDVVGAGREHRGALRGRRGRGDHPCTEQLAELHRGVADAAGGAQHQQRLAGAQPAAFASSMSPAYARLKAVAWSRPCGTCTPVGRAFGQNGGGTTGGIMQGSGWQRGNGIGNELKVHPYFLLSADPIDKAMPVPLALT